MTNFYKLDKISKKMESIIKIPIKNTQTICPDLAIKKNENLFEPVTGGWGVKQDGEHHA